MTLGLALVHRQTAADRDRGQKLLAEVSDVFLRGGHNLAELPIVNVYLARERARGGDRDEAITLMRAAVDHLFREGQLLVWGVPATGVLVETLLDRGADGDVAEAEAAIERLAAAPADEGLVMRDIWLLRLRALLARAHGDDALTRLSGSLPRHGENAWLRGAYRVGRGDAMTAAAPSGVVTFLFTDIEGSTRRWEADAGGDAGRRWPPMTRCCATRSRRMAAWCSSTPATGCAPRSRRRGPPSMLRWPHSGRWSCRCGWASRPVRPSCADGDYFGAVLNRAARVMARRARRPDPARRHHCRALLSGVDLIDLGTRRLRDIAKPVEVFQVRAAGLA